MLFVISKQIRHTLHRAFCLTIAWVSYFLEREFWHKTNVKEENLYMSYWCWLCMFILFCYMFLNKGKVFLLYSWMRSHQTQSGVCKVVFISHSKSFKIPIMEYKWSNRTCLTLQRFLWPVVAAKVLDMTTNTKQSI